MRSPGWRADCSSVRASSPGVHRGRADGGSAVGRAAGSAADRGGVLPGRGQVAVGDRAPGRRDDRAERDPARPARHLVSRRDGRPLLGRRAGRASDGPRARRRARAAPRGSLRDVALE